MGTVKEALNLLDSSSAGIHVMIVCHDLNLYREVYCRYTKSRLESGEVVILLSCFETVESVLHYLKEYGVDVNCYRSGTMLVILDSVARFFGTGPTLSTIFRFTLPVLQKLIAQNLRAFFYSRIPVMSGFKLRDLVVDDEPDITSIIQMGLKRKGFSVSVYNNPAYALKECISGGYDIALLDVGTP